MTHGFAIDQTGIAFTDHNNVVGDERIGIDPPAALLFRRCSWRGGPRLFFEQETWMAFSAASRGNLLGVEATLAKAGITAAVGHEIDSLLVDPSGHRSPVHAGGGSSGLLGALEQ